MTNLNTWNQNIYKALRGLGDKKRQEQTWLDDTCESISSPEEAYFRLMEDNSFEEYINDPQLQFNKEQKLLAKSFIDQLNKYYDSLPGYPDPKLILNDNRWTIICNEASKLIGMLNLKKYDKHL